MERCREVPLGAGYSISAKVMGQTIVIAEHGMQRYDNNNAQRYLHLIY